MAGCPPLGWTAECRRQPPASRRTRHRLCEPAPTPSNLPAPPAILRRIRCRMAALAVAAPPQTLQRRRRLSPAFRARHRRSCQVASLGSRRWRCRRRGLYRCRPCRCCRRNTAPPVLATTSQPSPSNPRHLAARPLPATGMSRPVRSSTLSQKPWPTTLPTMSQQLLPTMSSMCPMTLTNSTPKAQPMPPRRGTLIAVPAPKATASTPTRPR